MAGDPQGSWIENRSRNRESHVGVGFGIDPYGVLEIEEDGRCIGRSYFARAPENHIWVSFHDLPAEIVSALWNKVDANAYYDDWLLDV
jgi:hypothetical protein